MKKTKYKFLLLIFLLILLNFSCFKCVDFMGVLISQVNNPDEKFISFNFNFGGDWTHYQSMNINRLNFDLSSDLSTDSLGQIKRQFNITYKDKIPVLSDEINGNTSKYIKYNLPGDNYSFNLKTLSQFCENSKDFISFNKNYKITHLINNISYNFNADNNPVTKISLRTMNKYSTLDFIDSKYYTYKCNWKLVHPVVSDPSIVSKDNKLNIVILSEGFTENQMTSFRDMVNKYYTYIDNTSDPIYSEEDYVFWKNNVFLKAKDLINIIRIDSISLDSGIDDNIYDKKRTILDCYSAFGTTIADRARIEKILIETKPLGITKINEVDAFIIFVNGDLKILYNNGTAYVNLLLELYGTKNEQKILPIYVRTEKINDINKTFTKEYQKAITHELGHAIIQLDDEYSMDGFLGFIYQLVNRKEFVKEKSKNCDTNGFVDSVKWKSLFNIKWKNVRTLYEHSDNINNIIESKDSKKIISSSIDGIIKIWDIESGINIHTLSGHTGRINYIIETADEKNIISCSDDNTIKMWNIESGVLIRSFIGHKDNVKIVKEGIDGLTIISGADDNTVKIWDKINGSEIISFKHNGSISSIEETVNYIITSSFDKTINIWEKTSNIALKTLIGHKYEICVMKMINSGNILVSGDIKGEIKIWDIYTGNEIKTIFGHQNAVNGLVDFSDVFFISYSDDNTIKIWEKSSWILLKTLSGHQGRINNVIEGNMSNSIISCSNDGTIKIWDILSGQNIKTIYGHQDFINDMVYNTKNKFLISCSNDNTIRYWSSDGYEYMSNNDYRLTIVEGGVYYPEGKGIYRSSKESIMRHNSDGYNQFNPVSAYHMYGSIITRIGNIAYTLPNDLSNQNNNIWTTYSIDQFFLDFPPSSYDGLK